MEGVTEDHPAGADPESTGPVTLHDPRPDDRPQVTVVVPTRNEADSLKPLLLRLGPIVTQLSGEIIFADDSDDDTPTVMADVAPVAGACVRMLHRPVGDRWGGLSGAVISAARHARGDWVVVMDSDLQHPPESIPMLIGTGTRRGVDVVIGTRYAGSGSSQGLDNDTRKSVSRWSTRVAKLMFPSRLATVTDPMSGFFAFRRSAVDLDQLRPLGFKLLMEILVRMGSARLAEVTYEMSPREAGESKASLRQGLLFARHLARLRLAGLERLRDLVRPGEGGRPNQFGRMVATGLIGLSGIGVNLAALFAFHELVGLHHLVAAAFATQVSTLWNFVLTDVLVYRGQRDKSLLARAGGYFALNNALLLARLPVLAVLVWLGMGVLAANALTLVALFLIRFFVSDRVIYAAGSAPASAPATAVSGRDPVHVLVDIDTKESLPPPSRRRYQYLRYRYDIAGVVTIGSQIMLPELEFFRAQWVGDKDVDIAVRVGDVGGGPKLRASLTEYPNRSVLRYEEHFGRLGANFRIELGNPISIVVGPLLAASPHVVYTNIIEALLRFVMVSRGRMLLHSACVSVNGVGVMLSALTDTGKTATVLRILRDHGGLFLSDDMTLIDASGGAVCFPKPLTISAHTLRAVQAEDLTPAEWRRLQLQSRLHSKGGRSLALMLSRFNVPIMGINAITQRLVPPPKYSVDRLVPCRIGTATKVEELFIIERGAPRLTEMDRAEALERMIQNTDDAYGFPPFRYLAPGITINGYDYNELRRREREILAGFLSGVRTRVLASDNFGWADEIPRLIAQDRVDLNGARPAPVGAVSTVQAWPRWSELPVLVGAVG